jgi:hypothetical protein
MKLSENKAKKRLFRFAFNAKQKIGSETKNFGSESKRKYALLTSLWTEAKRSEK